MNDPRFEVYPQQRRLVSEGTGDEIGQDEFGWRFRAADGQITAVGREGFTRREDARRAVEDFAGTVVVMAFGGTATDVKFIGAVIDVDE